ncbi:MAG: pyridoxal 5'-phosphate synthase glutaminase subunit PdxT [Lachnospiraceae bacterium]|uniref:Pyridoxal 5'-phosphate synthase subunit PdxT n=1 Tax=Candidatus Weimeria bifida TaxID=2599074 RepID=A0A6N7IZK9_9FIRM|nr:pyridoxal 5'-phosphate synthase glutaminase subunit PdxT [Candidatus Weimeria bifida]RRF96554.1 MAG: pyridoxal 5'-phosphate synthase glutaminase subunit PdxT [Lachnospiraceae bacterium]
MKRVGVLALQGAFIEHEKMLSSLGADTVEIRQLRDLDGIDALVLPGGESTTCGKLLKDLGIMSPLREMLNNGLPVFGTCAGEILLAEKIDGKSSDYLATVPIDVKRNAYGRQLGSFNTVSEFKGIGEVPMTFIRAPYITSVGDGVEIKACVDGKIVGAEYNNELAISFHPEISGETSIHRYFLEKMVR